MFSKFGMIIKLSNSLGAVGKDLHALYNTTMLQFFSQDVSRMVRSFSTSDLQPSACNYS